MDYSAYIVDVQRLWPGEVWSAPIAIVDLDAVGDVPERLSLPPCPLVGIGDKHHPLAVQLDAMMETPVPIDAVLRQVLTTPLAAAVTVQLLRLLPEMAPGQGLAAESMAYGLLQGSAEHKAWLAAREQIDSGAKGRVIVERTGGDLTIVLDRPESGNAIDRAMRDGLHEAFTLALLDPEIRHVSLRARGRSFSLGAELAEFGTTTDPATAHAIRGATLPARAVERCADRLSVHVQGACVGAGLELAGWARRLTATPDAWFHLPELAMGILPGAGGCVSLTRRIGRQRTALMILSGKRINARQALDWGLVDAIMDEPPGRDSGANIS